MGNSSLHVVDMFSISIQVESVTDKAKMVTSQYLWVRLPWSKLVVAHIFVSVLSVDGTVASNLMTEELVVSLWRLCLPGPAVIGWWERKECQEKVRSPPPVG